MFVLSEAQVVLLCEQQSMATSVRPSLREEEHKPPTCDVSRWSVVLVAHVARQDSHPRGARSSRDRPNHENYIL